MAIEKRDARITKEQLEKLYSEYLDSFNNKNYPPTYPTYTSNTPTNIVPGSSTQVYTQQYQSGPKPAAPKPKADQTLFPHEKREFHKMLFIDSLRRSGTQYDTAELEQLYHVVEVFLKTITEVK